jgi:hypothetical protein
MPFWLLLTVPEGQREPILVPLIYMIVGYRFGYGRPLPRMLVLLAAPVALLLLSALADYKLALRSGEDVLTAFGSMVDVAIHSEPLDYLIQSIAVVGSRVNYVGIFATVMQKTPASIPFLHGETYSLFFSAMIAPRFLYPDKPSLGIYNDFAQRYGFVQTTDTWTSIAMPPVCELYLNFGYLGIIVGMFLFGILFRSLYTWAMGRSRLPGLQVLTYIAMAYPLARGDIFAMTMANVLKLLFGLFVFVLAFGKVPRRDRKYDGSNRAIQRAT